MQKHEQRQDVGVDRLILHQAGVDNRRIGMFEEYRGICLVEIAHAAQVLDKHQISDQQQQKVDVDLPASPDSVQAHGEPSLLLQYVAISDHAGIARDEDEHLG